MKKQSLRYRYNVLGVALIGFLCTRTYTQLLFKNLGLDKNFNIWLILCMVSLVLSCAVPVVIIEKMCDFRPFLFRKVKTATSAAMVAYGMLFITGFSVINQILFTLLEKIGVVFPPENLLPINGNLNFILYFIFVAILPAFCEEIFMRGYVLNMFSDYGSMFAIILSAIFFTFMHTNVQSFLPIFVAAVLLGCISLKTGSLRTCIALHFVNNAYSFLMMYFTRSIGGVTTLAFAAFVNVLILCCGLGGRVYLHKNGIFLSKMLQNNSRYNHKILTFFKSPVALVAAFACVFGIVEQLYLIFGAK
ncbi:MAG: type II CAAX endopeptidase family protein [Oscillospiraceae bacterium]